VSDPFSLPYGVKPPLQLVQRKQRVTVTVTIPRARVANAPQFSRVLEHFEAEVSGWNGPAASQTALRYRCVLIGHRSCVCFRLIGHGLHLSRIGVPLRRTIADSGSVVVDSVTDSACGHRHGVMRAQTCSSNLSPVHPNHGNSLDASSVVKIWRVQGEPSDNKVLPLVCEGALL
jgi:hypothetical protein